MSDEQLPPVGERRDPEGADRRASGAAFEARRRIMAHEEVCTERYDNIQRQLQRGEKRMDRIEGILIGTAGATVLQLLGVVILLASLLLG